MTVSAACLVAQQTKLAVQTTTSTCWLQSKSSNCILVLFVVDLLYNNSQLIEQVQFELKWAAI